MIIVIILTCLHLYSIESLTLNPTRPKNTLHKLHEHLSGTHLLTFPLSDSVCFTSLGTKTWY